MSKKLKWNDDYVKYGFTCATEKDETQRPQCILCSTLFPNANLKPSKLDEHSKNKHGGRDAGNDIVTLIDKKARFDQAGTLPTYGFSPTEKPLLRASYQDEYQIAKSKKPYTIGEELIKPCALEMAKIVLGKEAEKKLQQVSLSNVIHNRIIDMSDDILEQVVAEIKASPVKISLQVDESIDVSNCSLNELSLSLLGRGLNIVTGSEKLAAFKEKLALWIKRVKILNPFRQNLEDVDDDSGIKKHLIDLRHNRGTQIEFTNGQLEHFWASQLEAYTLIAKNALEVTMSGHAAKGVGVERRVKVKYRTG
ncbi:hypothetical protein O3P69_009033 [Scylla paramamosain]|uniref:Uncharacterized protein n=1 Tax=Scylla paramamosain TaxID=85552 RepID=A0AAW0TPV9_SCYPA